MQRCWSIVSIRDLLLYGLYHQRIELYRVISDDHNEEEYVGVVFEDPFRWDYCVFIQSAVFLFGCKVLLTI